MAVGEGEGASVSATATNALKLPMITRGLRVEVVKPIGATWDEVGPLLRTQRSIMHRLYTREQAELEALRAENKQLLAENRALKRRLAKYEAKAA